MTEMCSCFVCFCACVTRNNFTTLRLDARSVNGNVMGVGRFIIESKREVTFAGCKSLMLPLKIEYKIDY